MKRLILSIMLSVSMLPLMAQHADILSDMSGRVIVHQDTAISSLLHEKIEGAATEVVQVQGFRVQVFSSNSQQTAKSQAFRMEQKIKEAGLDVEVYVQYLPPFWKVRLGDYRTQDAARIMKEEVIRKLPELKADTYIVRDQITVKKAK